jgi:hypothetical protein
MKLISLLSVTAALAAVTFALGLAFGAVATAAYTFAAAASFALIIASDYAPRKRGYAAGQLKPATRTARERLPLAI